MTLWVIKDPSDRSRACVNYGNPLGFYHSLSLTPDELRALAEKIKYHFELEKACPDRGPNGECTCPGCSVCSGYEVDCTCDIDWDALTDLALDR